MTVLSINAEGNRQQKEVRRVGVTDERTTMENTGSHNNNDKHVQRENRSFAFLMNLLFHYE